MQTDATPVDVERYIDDHRLSARQIVIFFVCSLVAMADGFDAQAIGYVAPAIIHDWGVNRAALTPVFAAGLTGMALGGMLFGTLADRIGRRSVVLLCCVLFSVLTFAASLATSMTELTVLRFLAGLGIGGAMPNAVALTAEYAPRRIRATALMTMYSGFSLGAALGGFLSGWLIAAQGWQSVLFFGGAFPAFTSLAVLLWLPESIRFMVAKGDDNARVAALLRTFDSRSIFTRETRFIAIEPRPMRSPVAQLFEHRRALRTLLLWMIYFLSFLDLYLLSNWLPVMIHDAGASVTQAVFVTSLYQVGGVLGPILLGRLMDKLRPAAVMAVVMAVGGMVVSLIGALGIQSAALLASMVGIAGLTVIGGVVCSHYVAADAYPTTVRSTGLGWAFGAGRVGGIVGTLYGGALFALHIDIRDMLLAGALPLFIASALGAVFARIGNDGTPFFRRRAAPCET
ncbi:MFS transporter [Paraburkholderia sp. D15]|uniref:MFS transporter n=1 Tax=Paraburkholderia sp. D15 TaxID=2880218 RepID=UPI0024785A69|nr:MFS transporter [Paraburkholderia sp. D15]WGS54682.1 MFS transporter [Paraburkholderia sp. D15]